MNISNIAPLPQQLSQNGSSVVVNGKQAMLFRPVIHLFGRKNRTLNGEVSQLHNSTEWGVTLTMCSLHASITTRMHSLPPAKLPG